MRDADGSRGAGDARPVRPRPAAAATAGAALGASPFLEGLYGRTTWSALALVALLVVMVSLVTGREWPRPASVVLPAALAAAAGLQFLSSGWAESGAQAFEVAQRTALYAAGALLLVLLVQRTVDRVALLGGLAAGALLVVAWTLAQLLAESPDVYMRGRLDAPLGYTNGQAAALLLAAWPALALAEHSRRRLAGAAATAAAALAVNVSLLTQSRGALVALAASALVAVALLPGRARRVAALLSVAAGALVAGPAAAAVYDGASLTTGVPADGDPRRAALAALGGALVAAIGWLAASALADVAREALARNRGLRRGAAVAAGLLAAVAVALAGPPLADRIGDGWDRFKRLEHVSTESRLTSVGGNRYDFWRVAVEEFRREPVLGVGAGNYDRFYFLLRRSAEDVRQPHSLPLQALAETGLAGFLLLLLAAMPVAAAVLRARRGWVARSAAERGAVVAATGWVVLWATHTSIDWLHLLPGLTLAAIAAAAVLLAEPHGRPPWRHTTLTIRPVAFAAAVLAFATVGISMLAERSRDRARDQVASAPAAAADAAARAIELDDEALEGYYLLAAAQARLDRYEAARATLREAARREPHDFIPHALLGDLAVRAGDERQARADYGRAAALNPRDRHLQALAAGEPGA